MWCPRCRQDVPAIAAAFEQTLECARCRQPLSKLASEPSIEASAKPSPRQSAAPGDDLDLLIDPVADIDDILSRAEWLLGLDATAGPAWKPGSYVTGIHGPQQPTPPHHLSRERDKPRSRKQSRMMVASWCALAVALTGFVCGGVLLTWSLVANRPELWNVGETVTLASQVGLLVGLILQLDRIGQDRSQTVNRLTILDQRVESLRQSGPRRWSADSAHEAAPELLLADLKNQLEVLASKLGDKRSA